MGRGGQQNGWAAHCKILQGFTITTKHRGINRIVTHISSSEDSLYIVLHLSLKIES